MSKWTNKTKTRTYYAWRSMRSRCLDPNNSSWKQYGGRGISVCDSWVNDFDAFVFDMGEAPEGLSLDRIDVNGDYEKNNCRWATSKEQANNRTSNKTIDHGGKILTYAQWADCLGIGRDTLHRRLNVYKMPVEKALTKGLLVGDLKHGTRNAYERQGCRCDLCREANNKRHREMRKRKNQ
jgi:hypothetical protein